MTPNVHLADGRRIVFYSTTVSTDEPTGVGKAVRKTVEALRGNDTEIEIEDARAQVYPVHSINHVGVLVSVTFRPVRREH